MTPLLGVVAPPPPAAPPAQAETAVRDAHQWVVDELVRLRTERADINEQIRSLVADEERLRRAVRVLDRE